MGDVWYLFTHRNNSVSNQVHISILQDEYVLRNRIKVEPVQVDLHEIPDFIDRIPTLWIDEHIYVGRVAIDNHIISLHDNNVEPEIKQDQDAIPPPISTQKYGKLDMEQIQREVEKRKNSLQIKEEKR